MAFKPFDRAKTLLDAALRIEPGDHVPPLVAANFRHNAIVNTVDLMFFFFADSFWSINTIIPVFAATLTDSPFLIGLMPAIVNAGWFLPQLFISGYVSRLPKVVPLSIKLGILERVSYLFFPILALLIPSIPKSTALTLLIILMVWRGLAGGFSALPWQEVMARVIPITQRARYYGFSRVLGQIMGVIASAISAAVLARYRYPYGYAIGFGIAVVAQWISFAAYSQNRDPGAITAQEPAEFTSARSALEADPPEAPRLAETMPFAPSEDPLPAPGLAPGGLALFRTILKEDKNFRLYLLARSISFLGNMGSAFLAVYAIQTFHLSDESAAIFTGVLFLSGILGYALWGAVGDRIGPKRIVVISFLFWVGTMVVALASRQVWVYYLAFVFFGLYNAGMNVGDSILVMELGPENLRPTYLGMARTLTGIFLLLAPILAGWLVQVSGYPLMFCLSVVFTLLAAVLMNQVRDAPRGERGKLNARQNSQPLEE